MFSYNIIIGALFLSLRKISLSVFPCSRICLIPALDNKSHYYSGVIKLATEARVVFLMVYQYILTSCKIASSTALPNHWSRDKDLEKSFACNACSDLVLKSLNIFKCNFFLLSMFYELLFYFLSSRDGQARYEEF